MSVRGRATGLGLSRVDGTQPQAVTDQLTIENVSVPTSQVPGNTFQVTARVSCQAVPFTDCEAAVRFILGGQEVRVPRSGVTDVPENGQDTFTANLQMPQQTTTLVVEAIERGAVGGFNVEDSAEFSIEAVTQQQKTLQTASEFGVWGIGGGAVGAGAAHFLDEPVLGGLAIGAGAGLGTKVAVENLSSVGLGGILPEFPTGAVLALTALLGAAALFFVVTPTGRLANVVGRLGGGGSSRSARRALPSP